MNRCRLRTGASSAVLAAVIGSADPLAAQERTPQDRVREAALAHLTNVLYPPDPDPERPHCIGIHAEDLDRPPALPGEDPSPALLTAVRAFLPQAVPRSACDLSSQLAISGAGIGVVRRPVSYHVGAVRASGGRATATVSYLIGEQRGGGWICDLSRSGSGWAVRDCRPLWLS